MSLGWAFTTNHARYRLVISPAPRISTGKSSTTSSTTKNVSPCAFVHFGAGSLATSTALRLPTASVPSNSSTSILSLPDHSSSASSSIVEIAGTVALPGRNRSAKGDTVVPFTQLIVTRGAGNTTSTFRPFEGKAAGVALGTGAAAGTSSSSSSLSMTKVALLMCRRADP
jgi:hypothetical protein